MKEIIRNLSKAIGIPGWGVIPLRRWPSVNWVEGIIDCANSSYPRAEPSTATTQFRTGIGGG
jgi:hypothetical protein